MDFIYDAYIFLKDLLPTLLATGQAESTSDLNKVSWNGQGPETYGFSAHKNFLLIDGLILNTKQPQYCRNTKNNDLQIDQLKIIPQQRVSRAVRKTDAEQWTTFTARYVDTSLCSTEKSCFHFRRRQDIRPLSNETQNTHTV